MADTGRTQEGFDWINETNVNIQKREWKLIDKGIRGETGAQVCLTTKPMVMEENTTCVR